MEYTLTLKRDPFEDDQAKKDAFYTEQLQALTQYHIEHCPPYARMMEALQAGGPGRVKQPGEAAHYSELPFLPVTLFKKLRLSSMPDDAHDYKTVTSSGTSSQQTSQIILDAQTRTLQQQVLASIGSSFLGGKRLPMLVVDCEATVKKRDRFSARTSAILGFSLFGRNRTFALKDDMSLDVEAIETFLAEHGGEPFLIFGFTFMVWRDFCQEIEKQGLSFDCSNAILLHGGGWKKLIDSAVSKEEFKAHLHEVIGVKRVMDYYGMAEQTGSIYFECECGHLHVSDYSAVLTRRAQDFSLCEIGEPGLLQVMSLIPKSYPGHNLLTEDEGRILGVDDCPCGRKGTYFEVLGRVKNAELRGCSDTYAAGR